MKRALVIFLLAIAAGRSWAVDLNVRHFYVTNDVATARPAVSPLRYYAGESVKMDLYVTRNGSALDLSGAGMFPRWEVFTKTNTSLAFIMSTGTIANATNGYVTFDLTPAVANVPTNTYDSYVKLYQPVDGTNRYVGMVYKTDLQVYWSPSSTNFTYQGPYTNATGVISVGKDSPQTGIITFAGDGVTQSGSTFTFSGGETNHASLSNLDYASAGHTGFQPAPAEGPFIDGDKTKLDGIEAGAEVNNISDANATDLTDAGDSALHYHATDRARANHTGTQTASTISDFDATVTANAAVTANTAKVSFPEAPQDGTQYARKNAGWEAVAGGNPIDGRAATNNVDLGGYFLTNGVLENVAMITTNDGIATNNILGGVVWTNTGSAVSAKTNAMVGFMATRSVNQTNAASAVYVAKYDLELYDSENAYNTNTYQYTIPKTGRWLLNLRDTIYEVDDNYNAQLRAQAIVSGGTDTNGIARYIAYSPGANRDFTCALSSVHEFQEGDVIYAEVFDSNPTRDTFWQGNGTTDPGNQVMFCLTYVDTIWGDQ